MIQNVSRAKRGVEDNEEHVGRKRRNMAASVVAESCYLCGITETQLFRCGRCKCAWYCSREHQKEHWRTHKRICVDSNTRALKSQVTSSSNNLRSSDSSGESSRGSGWTSTDVSPLDRLNDNFISISYPNSPAVPFILDERKARFYRLADKVNTDLNRKGYSFLDGFLGTEKCREVLQEVAIMHRSGRMKDGEVISRDLLKDGNERIRDDKITWIYGQEQNCQHIASHMKDVDYLIHCYKKMQDKYDIRGRTPAMVACYPGGGTHYVKHIDNPTGDGRCITTLFYLNEDWDCTKYGGQLRLYPYGRSDYVDIEPIMDRLLLFWSDKRMPHEVIPAHRIRYTQCGTFWEVTMFSVWRQIEKETRTVHENRFAITLWYFDVEERAKATLKFYEKALSTS